jgi:hypothetical protein
MKLKRTLAAVLLASLTLPVFAAEYSPPFEQAQLDRTLPNVQDPVVSDSASSGATIFGLHEGLPYEQTVANMALPNVKDPVVRDIATSQPIVVAGPATGVSSPEATGPWASDFNFIAPAP